MSVSIRRDSLTRELEQLLVQLLTMEPKGFRPNDYNSGAYNPHGDDDPVSKAFTIFKTREYKGYKLVDLPLFFGRFFSVKCNVPLLQAPLIILPPRIVCPCCGKSHDPSKWKSEKERGDTAKNLEKLKKNAKGL